jgi:6-phosphofructokinase 1
MLKGNALVGQSGGPTSVINSSLCGVVQQALKSENIENIFGMSFGIEGFMNDEVVDLGKESPEIIEGLRTTPGSALGSSRHKVKDHDFPVIMEQLKKYNIRYFFLIGGNDTMDTIHRVEEYCASQGWELRGVGVPKTVDNDLYCTDHTPGFSSAANYVVKSVQQAGRLGADMQRVDQYVIYQTVGRDAGWLACSSVVAKKNPEDAPHLIYVPEKPISKAKFLADVEITKNKYGWCSIVVGEGARWDDGTYVSAPEQEDKHGNPELGAMGGTSAALNMHKMISNKYGWRGEFQIVESLAMCAMDRASKTDLEEAYQCGVHAVIKAHNEAKTAIMVTIDRVSNSPYTVKFGEAPLNDVAVDAKEMPPEFLNEEGNFVTEAFLEYIKPLVDEPAPFSVLSKVTAEV